MAVLVPKLNSFYPAVPLKELTNLYSVGNHAFEPTPANGAVPAKTHRVAILSYLPQTLMIYEGFEYNNKYVLLAENIEQLDQVNWSVDLFLNGIKVVNTQNFVRIVDTDLFDYSIYFKNSVVDASGMPLFDRMIVKCTIKKGAVSISMALQHTFAKAVNVTGLISGTQSIPFAGEPHTYNFLSNQLKEYFSEDLLKWNSQNIENPADSNKALTLMLLAIFYYNIQSSSSMSTKTDRSFEWNDFSQPDLKKVINESKYSEIDFVVGLGRIPINTLNDVMDDLSAAPVFSNINDNNRIYKILSANTELIYSDLDDCQNITPPLLKQSKQILFADQTRLSTLYHYSMFPKSAIRMVAILFRFLFEVSKKNSCNECKNRKPNFLSSKLENLFESLESIDLTRNILTHYYKGPYNKIAFYPKEAQKVASLSVSPYIYSLLHNVSPRILKAYFAHKKVEKITDDFKLIDFVRIDSSQIIANADGVSINYSPNFDAILGSQVFLIIETAFCGNKKIDLSLHAPLLTNNNNAIEFSKGRRLNEYQTLYSTSTGNFDDLDDSRGVLSGLNLEYLEVNHKQKVILKTRIKPRSTANFTQWSNSLANQIAAIEIKTALHNNSQAFYGNEVTKLELTGYFLSNRDPYSAPSTTFRVRNGHLFELYEENENDLNSFNPYPHPMTRIVNPYEQSIPNGSAYYYYFNKDGVRHFITSTPVNKQTWIKTSHYDVSPYDGVEDNQGNTVSIGSSYMVHPFQVDPNWQNYPFVPAANGATKLFLPLNNNYKNEFGDWASILDTNQPTPRYFIDMTCFASLIASTMVNKIPTLGFNGFSSQTGASVGGSVSHVNGVRGDLRYLNNATDGAPCYLYQAQFNFHRQISFNNALHHFGWGRSELMLSERYNGNNLLPYCVHFHKVKVGAGAAAITYNSKDVTPGVNIPQEIIAPLPPGALLAVGDSVNASPVRHSDHLHVQGFDFSHLTNILTT